MEKHLYYAFTNTQIINMINVKNSFFPNILADLYVIDHGRISENLIQNIVDEKIFDCVYYIIHHPHSKLRKSVFRLPGILRKPILSVFIGFNYLQYQRFFHKQNEVMYSVLFMPGFWTDAGYFANHYYRYNPKLSIYFVEEGTVNYTAGIYNLCYILNSFHPVVRLLWKFTNGGNKISDFKKLISHVNGMYLYVPENHQQHNDMEKLLLLPSISKDSSTHRLLTKSTSEMVLARYNSCNVIYFMQNQNQDIIQYTIFGEYMQEITSLSSVRLLIKQHPDYSVSCSCFNDLNNYLHDNAVIDCDDYLLEGIYAKIDLDSKILITRDSSSVMYPKYMFSKEPIVIFTYKLYSDYYSENSKKLDGLMHDLSRTYADKSKIYAPQSIDDLVYLISKLV